MKFFISTSEMCSYVPFIVRSSNVASLFVGQLCEVVIEKKKVIDLFVSAFCRFIFLR